jgi:beta-RFAP synthase
LLDRGARSSIGIATFEQGGVVLDGGRGDSDEPPPLLSRLPFPEPWRVLLIFDQGRQGLHGPEEAAAFRGLAPFPAAQAAHLCRVVLMVALPALAEEDLDRFGGACRTAGVRSATTFEPVQGARFHEPQGGRGAGLARIRGHRRHQAELLGADRIRP